MNNNALKECHKDEECRKKIGRNIDTLRKARGLSMLELASATGYYTHESCKSQMSKIITGKAFPPTDLLVPFSVILGVPLAELFRDVNDFDPALNGINDDMTFSLSQEETRLLSSFRDLSPEAQEKLMEYLRMLLYMDKIEKHDTKDSGSDS